MPTIATILVALDIERGACDTCDEAGLVARAFGARVVAVNAQAEPEQAGDAALEARDQEFLAELTARIGAASPPTLVRRVGAPADVILGVAERESADLIVLGAAPKAAVERILMGATAEAVLRRATVPVWVVPAGGARRGIRVLVCGIDGSPAARAALATAAAVARTFAARLCLVTVAADGAPAPGAADERDLQANPGEVDLEGIELTSRVEQGDASAGILRAAEAEGADLLVLGSAGRTGLARFRRANTAERLARRAPCSLLAVPVPARGDCC